MKRELLKFGIVSFVIFILLMIAMVGLGRTATRTADQLLDPWFTFCAAVTPDSWETQGNILLGLFWLVSGLFAYSMLISAVLVSMTSAIIHAHRARLPS